MKHHFHFFTSAKGRLTNVEIYIRITDDNRLRDRASIKNSVTLASTRIYYVSNINDITLSGYSHYDLNRQFHYHSITFEDIICLT